MGCGFSDGVALGGEAWRLRFQMGMMICMTTWSAWGGAP